MPDTRRHRGPHPEDRRLFDGPAVPRLRRACAHLSWLLGRGYATPGALKLVGDRFSLMKRQRTAVMRCSCGDAVAARRRRRAVPPAVLRGAHLLIDGHNVLTTVEAALSGGLVMIGRDGTHRDMASVHGTWRQVEETLPALERITRVLSSLEPASVHWYLDRPVSNSARLKRRIVDTGRAAACCAWTVELVHSADAALVDRDEVIASADSAVIDRCRAWFDLAGHTVREHAPDAWVLDLRGASG
jgi:hypothetical protein